MDALELLDIIQMGESSKVQFKARVNNANSVGAEMVAFSNTKGGIIIVGVDDKTGTINGLSFKELQTTNELLANVASNNVKDPIYIYTETVKVKEQNVIVAHIAEGTSKPHMDNNGIIWVKNGSDKRKVITKEEIARLLQSSGNLFADETLVTGTTVNDCKKELFLYFFVKNWGGTPKELNISLLNALKNTNVVVDNHLTLGGLLFFGKDVQKFRPAFCIKAVSYYGTKMEGSDYRDSEDIKGIIPEMFKNAMAFVLRNLKKTQQGQNFNSVGQLEVSQVALEELLQNALIHRNYLINAPIRLFIFDNRIEIISPGCLPNNLTIENIKFGTTVIRNNLLTSFCSKIMNYRVIGSGIKRAIKEQPNLELINDTNRELFVSLIKRP